MAQPRYWDGQQTDYVDGVGPAIKSDDLNGLQLDEATLWRAFRHAELDISDDFAGLSTFAWANVTNTAMIGAEANANSTVDLNTNPGGFARLATPVLNRFGTRDFYFSARLRVPTFGGCQTRLGGDGVPFYWQADASVDAVNWRAIVGGVSVAVGPPVDNNFRELEIYRFGGTIYFRTDGALIYSAADASNVTGKVWGITMRNITGDGEIRLDRLRLTILADY